MTARRSSARARSTTPGRATGRAPRRRPAFPRASRGRRAALAQSAPPAPPGGGERGTGGLPEPPGRHNFSPLATTELWDALTNTWRIVAPVKSPRAFARLVVAHRGIYQMSGVALDEHADPTVERFVWR